MPIKYIKFQDPSIKSVTDGWTNIQTDGWDRTFEVGGIKNTGPVIYCFIYILFIYLFIFFFFEFRQKLIRSLHLRPKLYAKYHEPSSTGSPDIVFTKSIAIMRKS